MYHNTKLYGIFLEDYYLPRAEADWKVYIGSEQEIETFLEHLKEHKKAAKLYDGYIKQLEAPVDPRDRCMVAGHDLELRHPVEELHFQRSRDSEAEWEYATSGGDSYSMYADQVDIAQLLVKWNDDCYCRCAKIVFQNLMIRMRGVGWVELKEEPKGFPGVCYRDDWGYHASMYTVQQVYRADQLEQAIRDMADADKLYYALACRDILGDF